MLSLVIHYILPLLILTSMISPETKPLPAYSCTFSLSYNYPCPRYFILRSVYAEVRFLLLIIPIEIMLNLVLIIFILKLLYGEPTRNEYSTTI